MPNKQKQRPIKHTELKKIKKKIHKEYEMDKQIQKMKVIKDLANPRWPDDTQ